MMPATNLVNDAMDKISCSNTNHNIYYEEHETSTHFNKYPPLFAQTVALLDFPNGYPRVFG